MRLGAKLLRLAITSSIAAPSIAFSLKYLHPWIGKTSGSLLVRSWCAHASHTPNVMVSLAVRTHICAFVSRRKNWPPTFAPKLKTFLFSVSYKCVHTPAKRVRYQAALRPDGGFKLREM